VRDLLATNLFELATDIGRFASSGRDRLLLSGNLSSGGSQALLSLGQLGLQLGQAPR
jgi:hypothetical protein